MTDAFMSLKLLCALCYERKKYNRYYYYFQLSSIVFQTVVPDHWCHVPGREDTNFTVKEWKSITIPL